MLLAYASTDACAALLVATTGVPVAQPREGAPGSPNLSPRVSAAPLEVVVAAVVAAAATVIVLAAAKLVTSAAVEVVSAIALA